MSSFPKVNPGTLSRSWLGRLPALLERSTGEARAGAFAVLRDPGHTLPPSWPPLNVGLVSGSSAPALTSLLPGSQQTLPGTPPAFIPSCQSSLPCSLLPSLPGTMLLESLHPICFCGRPASCAHFLTLEMKAKGMEAVWIEWLPSWVLPEERTCLW